MSNKATLQVYRGDKESGQLETYEVETYPGMVVLDAIHDIQTKQEPSLAVDGTARQGDAARAARRSTASRSSCA
jgi:succinate dehydrogenase/fumarate reductase-like Fe-S protein